MSSAVAEVLTGCACSLPLPVRLILPIARSSTDINNIHSLLAFKMYYYWYSNGNIWLGNILSVAETL